MAKLGLKRSGFESQLDVTQYVAISDIRTDPSHQHRAQIDLSVVSDYAEVLRGGSELAPVKLIRDEADLWLWDGHQTLEAARIAGVKQLRAEIERGTKRDAWKKSLGANHKHGARRTRDDLAKAIRSAITDREIRYSLLAEDGEYTYTSVAELVQTSKTSIRNHWNKYVAEEVNQEIDEALAQDSDMIAPQKEIAALVAKELHVPHWLVEQRQIEVAFNLSRPESEINNESAATAQAPTPATGPAKAPKAPPDDDNDDEDEDIGTLELNSLHTPALKLTSVSEPKAEEHDDDDDKDVGTKQPPNAPAIKLTSADDDEPPTPQPVPQPAPESSDNESLFKRPRSDFKHADLPIYQWEPLRRAAISPEELEELITTIRMAGGSIMEVNASDLHLEMGKERKELPSLPDVWGGNTYYVIKLKVKK